MGIFILALLLPMNGNDPVNIILLALFMCSPMIAFHEPRLGLAAFIALKFIIWGTGGYFGFTAFCGPFLLVIVAATTAWEWTTLTVSAVLIFGLYDPYIGRFITDAPTVIVWSMFTAIGLGIGLWIRRTIRIKREVLAAEAYRHDEMAKALHDSVAATLTSLVVRVEALGIQRAADKELASELGEIADLGRDAIAQTRTLLASLKTPEGLTGEEAGPGLESIIASAADSLSGHGFTVETDFDLDRHALTAAQNTALSHVVREATTNIIKYADAQQPVAFKVRADERTVVLSVENGVENAVSGQGGVDVKLTPTRKADSSGIGMSAMRGHMKAIRGSILTRRTGTRWELEARAPR